MQALLEALCRFLSTSVDDAAGRFMAGLKEMVTSPLQRQAQLRYTIRYYEQLYQALLVRAAYRLSRSLQA